MINKVTGKLIPIRDNILITDMDFGEQKTAGGLVLLSDDGKAEGVRHRWGRVWAIGPEQKDIKVGEWIYVAHGRWTRGITIEDEVEGEIIIRRVDNNDVLLSADEPPKDVLFNNL